MNKKRILNLISISLLTVNLWWIPSISSATNLDTLKSSANKNQLTAQNRDKLIDELKKLRQENPALVNTINQNLTTLANEIKVLKQKDQSQGWEITQIKNSVSSVENYKVPSWSVLAFDLTECPSWWQPYQAASERFIMGSPISNNRATQLRERWGNKSIMMRADQIAPHSHLFEDTAYNDGWGDAHHHFKRDVTAESQLWGKFFGAEAWHDRDNSLYTVLRRTSKQISDKEWWYNAGFVPASIAAGEKWLTQKPLEILNPYIKLLYCKKI